MGVREMMNLPSDEAPGLTSDMRRAGDLAAMRAAQKSRDEIVAGGKQAGLQDSIRAKFKIEVTFGAGRTTVGPNLVGIQVWESGKRLNGGGDDLAFWCQSTETNEGCWAIITSDNVRGGIGLCPSCKRAVNADLLTNMRIGRVSTKNLSNDLEKIFRDLGSNADIYLKYHQTDMRYLAMERAKGNNVAKRLKGMHIYPLRNILSDTAHGAAVAGRFHSFLTS